MEEVVTRQEEGREEEHEPHRKEQQLLVELERLWTSPVRGRWGSPVEVAGGEEEDHRQPGAVYKCWAGGSLCSSCPCSSSST